MRYTAASVRQLTNRKNKPWQARLKYKDLLTGKWKEISKILPEADGKKKARKLAEEWRAELNAMAENSDVLEQGLTVNEMYYRFLEFQLTSGDIEKGTYCSHLSHYAEYVKNYIGDIDFISLDRNAIMHWLTQLNARGLSQATISDAFSLPKKVYTYYCEIGDLNKNPFTGIKAPRRNGHTITHLTPEQMDDYLAAVYEDYNPEDRMFAGALILFYAGLRRGEVCGLRWRDVDLERGTLSVETSIGITTKKVMGSTTYTKQPKNNTSIRTFTMVPQLTEALKQRYNAIHPESNWFVCGKETKWYNSLTFGGDFRKFVRRHNLVDAYGQPLTPHMLRHNLGAVGIRSGMDIASLSRMFGHASRAMTLDTYGDATKDAMITAAAKLGDTFNDETEYFKE